MYMYTDIHTDMSTIITLAAHPHQLFVNTFAHNHANDVLSGHDTNAPYGLLPSTPRLTNITVITKCVLNYLTIMLHSHMYIVY